MRYFFDICSDGLQTYDREGSELSSETYMQREARRVLAEIASILGRNDISIASVIQHEADEKSGVVPLVIMTHRTTEGATQSATDTIDRLAFMRQDAGSVSSGFMQDR